ncbi:hypothetical protein B0T21DRAFT_450752 [Apiosordaria backusii]|uniref:Uncharacterized protein n=1 Tax=Apiosordaria backusii TaxID=314023 RepID=A0AA40BP04_9PEZI|nr:hypothetical protein B0T21DRAFT_450752 [Apiosordaria backusii]
MDDDLLWMTEVASRKKKHNHRVSDDRRRSDRPERSRHTRDTKERSHDRSRHTDAVERPLNYAGNRHLPEDRADPSERVRAWVQRTQNRHSHRSLPTAPDSDERLRRTSSPRYRGADIIRGKKRGRSVSRSPSVSSGHGFDGGRVESRFEKRRRYKTHEDKYEYKGDVDRKKQPSKELRVEPGQEAASRMVVDRHQTTRVPVRVINTDNHMRFPDLKSKRASGYLHANYVPEPRHSSSSSKLLEDRNHSGHHAHIIPPRPSRQYVPTHSREPQPDLRQDASYFSSSSRTSSVAYEQERKRHHFSKEPNSHGRTFPINGLPGSKSMNHPGEPDSHGRLSAERHQGASPPVQLATPLAKDPLKHRGTGAVPPTPQHVVTVVLPRYKDVETQTDPSLLAGLLRPIADVAKAPDQPANIASQVNRGHEIQRRIQLLPDSPYPNTKPPLINALKHEPSRQRHEPLNKEVQAYAPEQAICRVQDSDERTYLEGLVSDLNAPMQSQRYAQAPVPYFARGGSQPRYLGQYHTSHFLPLSTSTSADDVRTDQRLSDLVQRHEAPSPPRTMMSSQQLAQRLGHRVRFQEPESTFRRLEEPYMEDIDDFIKRIEEEDLGDLSDVEAGGEYVIPTKAEEYDGLGELKPIVSIESAAEDYDTEVLMGSRRNGVVGDENSGPGTPGLISRLPVSISTSHLVQDGADSLLTGRLSRAGQAMELVGPGQYRKLYET